MPFKAGSLCPVSSYSHRQLTHMTLCMGSSGLLQEQQNMQLHRHPHSNLPKMSYTRVPFKAGRLCCVSRLRLYQQPSVWLVVMSWWFFEVLDGTETF